MKQHRPVCGFLSSNQTGNSQRSGSRQHSGEHSSPPKSPACERAWKKEQIFRNISRIGPFSRLTADDRIRPGRRMRSIGAGLRRLGGKNRGPSRKEGFDSRSVFSHHQRKPKRIVSGDELVITVTNMSGIDDWWPE